MFVTQQELKAEVRNLRSEIRAVAKDLGGDIGFLNQRILHLEEILENQQQLLNKISESLNNGKTD